MKHTFNPVVCELCKKGMKTNNRSPRNICYKCMSKTPPEKYRCKGINGQKKRCGQWAKVNLEWCAHHIPKED